MLRLFCDRIRVLRIGSHCGNSRRVSYIMATTADILGLSKKPRIPGQWTTHHSRLCGERDDLISKEPQKLEAVTNAKMDDLSDAGADETQTSLMAMSASSTQFRLSQVLAAIQRIEKGGYGICEITGEQIEDDRLQAIPWARYSLQGQYQIEKSNSSRTRTNDSIESIMESAETTDAEKED